MIYIENKKIEIWNLTETGKYDTYSDEQEKVYTLNKTIQLDFQNVSPAESLVEFGEILQDTYKIYTEENIPETAILRIKGEKDTYTIKGSKQVNDHFKETAHNKIYLVKEREAHKLEE